ncbi:MAG: hypothetical protein J6L83_07265 [Clostridia bacterium]|nr:hypothetical protein [Clostridia bacterium]
MGFVALMYVVQIILELIILYGVFKFIWYAVKILGFKRFISKISKRDNVKIETKRKFSEKFWGKKFDVDYIISVGEKKYEITVLSFISTHGRWNIEKTRTKYYAESRRASGVFFGKYTNSNAPDHVSEYKGEWKVRRKELILSPLTDEFEKQIILIYPNTKRVTYTDSQYNIIDYHRLDKRNMIEGHPVVGVKELIEILEKEDE